MGKDFGIGLWILIGILDVVLVVVVAYLVSRALNERFRQEQQNRADNVILSANEQAKTIELDARNKALRIIQESEADLSRRRKELVLEEERLTKRRQELDHRVERLEQREQQINKRQGVLDKRANDVEKMAGQQIIELQRVAEMSVEEARYY
jgi:ribonuclease Y